MRTLLAMALGLTLGGAAVWFYINYGKDLRLQSAGQKVETAAKSVRNASTNELQVLHLRPDDIKDELARSGQVVRRAASDAGRAIADATADARVTAAIKGKLLASRDLSALNISVNTTAGIVTLSGAVASSEHISKAILLAMQSDGVREVVSTLQVRSKQK
ncbi:MAG: BON domain-containing protein [Verrucomicrobiota bacterium]|jgi:hyperosmotically inducible periplasmic protein